MCCDLGPWQEKWPFFDVVLNAVAKDDQAAFTNLEPTTPPRCPRPEKPLDPKLKTSKSQTLEPFLSS